MSDNKPLNRSELIRDRFISVSQNNELHAGDEVAITQHLFNRLNFLPMADAAKAKGISYNGMKKRIAARKEMFLEVGSQTFVSI